MSAAADFPPVTQVVPHRGAMLLLERVLAHDGDHTVARVLVGRGGWLQRDDSSGPAWLALEYMAQCAAAHEGLLARAEGRPLPRGFLITARTLCLHRSHFTGGDLLRVEARRARGRPGLGALSHSCSVYAGSAAEAAAVVASGRLSVSVEAASQT